MKKIVFICLMVVVLLVATTSVAFAGGDKVRGEKGNGSVNQIQVQDPPPFQP